MICQQCAAAADAATRERREVADQGGEVADQGGEVPQHCGRGPAFCTCQHRPHIDPADVRK